MTEVTNRVVLVTGAAGGIGQALCRAFAAAGMLVGVCDVNRTGSESLADADPELFTLLRASGVQWAYGRRHARNAPTVVPPRMTGVNRTIDPRDAIHALYANTRAETYFESAAAQVQA